MAAQRIGLLSMEKQDASSNLLRLVEATRLNKDEEGNLIVFVRPPNHVTCGRNP